MRGVIAQVWTAPKCEPGAIALGALPDVVSDTWTESRTDTASGTLVVRRDAVRAIGLEVGRIIRTVHPSRGVQEWVVASIEDRDGAGSDGLMRVRCAPIRALLGLRGLVRTVTPPASPVVAFTPAAMTPTAAIETYLLTNAAADGLTWLSVGVVESTEPMTLAPFSLATRGSVLAALEETTRLKAVLRPLTNDAGYAIDLLRDPGASLDTVRLSLATGAAVVSRTRDVRRAPTALLPVTANGALIGATAWRVTAVASDVVTIRDPDAVGDLSLAPVQIDGQLVGAFLRRPNGTTSRILFSHAADSSVTLASATGFAVDDLVTLAEDAAGTPLSLLTDGDAVQRRGRIIGTVRIADTRSERTLVGDPFLENAGALSVVGTGEATLWSRSAAPASGLLNGAVSSASSITVDGFPANTVVHRHQPIRAAAEVYTASADTLISTTGTVSVPITPSVSTEIANDSQLVWADGATPRGVALANGVQAVAATSLVLDGLPATTAWLSGDTLRSVGDDPVDRSVFALSTTGATPTATFAGFPTDLAIGRGVRLAEYWVNLTGPFAGFPVLRETEGTVASTYTGGATSINLSLPGRSVTGLGGGTIVFVSSTLTLLGTPSVTLSVSGVPTWGAARTASVTLTAPTDVALPSGASLQWRRSGGALVGDVTTTAAVSVGATSFTVLGPSTLVRVIENGDTLTVGGGRVYATATTTLSGAGAGTIAVTTTPVWGDNLALTLEAPGAWGDGPGGDTVVLVRGATGASHAVQSATFPIPGTGSLSAVARVQWRLWTPTPSSTGSPSFILRDTTAGADRITVAGSQSLPSDDPVTVVTVGTGTVTGGNTHQLRFYRAANLAARFEFVEHVMVTLGSDTAVPFTQGAYANVAFRTALQQLADATAGARFRVEGEALRVALASIGTETAPLAIGQRVRLVVPSLAVDVTVRVDQLTYSFGAPDRWQADLAGVPPRLSSIGVTTG